jgi:hypothetical protein
MTYTQTFSLTQHTPIIHFKYDDACATLRATELKPKLDRYLIQKAFSGDINQYKNYLVGYTADREKQSATFVENLHPALDYKVRVEAQANSYISGDNFPNYFGNQTPGGAKKHLKISTAPVTVHFHSLHENLIALINKHFSDFLWEHNFGTRQSKGFGSFTTGTSGKNIQSEKLPYYFDVATKDTKDVFEYIQLFYKSLRSGINFPSYYDKYKKETKNSFYMKAAIFWFAKSKNSLWDKRLVKAKFFNKDWDSQFEKQKRDRLMSDELFWKPDSQKPVPEQLLWRAVFGLSTSENWGRKYGEVSINRVHSNDKIKRYASPVFFKPIKLNAQNYRVYFGAREVDKEFQGERFNVTMSDEKNKALQLSVPSDSDFTYKHFFEFIMSPKLFPYSSFLVNGSQNPDGSTHKADKIIKSIYDELQTRYGQTQ